MATLTINGKAQNFDAEPDTPLLYALRDHLGMNGAKFGCGLGQCGACTVLIDGRAAFSCVTPISVLDGKKITTLEGLGTPEKPGALQRAFIEEQAAQCGYCTAGIIVKAHELLSKNRQPTDAQIRAHLSPNLCRCGTHNRVITAVKKAAGYMTADAAGQPHRPDLRSAAMTKTIDKSIDTSPAARCSPRAAPSSSRSRSAGALAQTAAPPARRRRLPRPLPPPPPLPGALRISSVDRRLDQDRGQRRRHRVHRQVRARPGHQDRAYPGRRRAARRGLREGLDRHRRYRAHRQRRLHRRLASRWKAAAPRSCMRRRRRARS